MMVVKMRGPWAAVIASSGPDDPNVDYAVPRDGFETQEQAETYLRHNHPKEWRERRAFPLDVRAVAKPENKIRGTKIGIVIVGVVGLSMLGKQGLLAAPAQAAGNVAYESYAMNLLEECKPGSLSPELTHFMEKILLPLQTVEEKKRARDKLLQQGKTFGGNKDKFCAWLEETIGPTAKNMNDKILQQLQQLPATGDDAKVALGRAIRGAGYNCPSVWNYGDRGEDHYGKVYRVRCGPVSGSGTYDQMSQFKVTVLNGRARVAPW